jgi:hypothetical protein
MVDHLGMLLVSLCNPLQLSLCLCTGFLCCRFRRMGVCNRALHNKHVPS